LEVDNFIKTWLTLVILVKFSLTIIEISFEFDGVVFKFLMILSFELFPSKEYGSSKEVEI